MSAPFDGEVKQRADDGDPSGRFEKHRVGSVARRDVRDQRVVELIAAQFLAYYIILHGAADVQLVDVFLQGSTMAVGMWTEREDRETSVVWQQKRRLDHSLHDHAAGK